MKSIKNTLEDKIVAYISIIFVTLVSAIIGLVWNLFASKLPIINYSILITAAVIVFIMSWVIIRSVHHSGNEIRQAINLLEKETNNFGSAKLNTDESDITIEELSLLENTFHNLLARFAAINTNSADASIPEDVQERIKSHLPLSKGEFNQAVYYLLRANSSYRSSYILVQLINNNGEFRNALIEYAQKFFGSAVLGEYSDDTLSIFIPEVDSVSLLKARLKIFYANFTAVRVDRTRENIEVASIRCAAVVYPYSSRRELERDADFALRKTNDYIVYIPQKRAKLLARYESIENISRLFLLNSEPILKELRSAHDFDSFHIFLKNNLLKFARQFGYMNAGFLLLNTSHTEYNVYFEDTRMNSPATFRRLEKIPAEYILPIYKAAGDDHCIYGDMSQPLEPELARLLENIGVNSFFFQTIVDKDGTNLGLLYLCSATISTRPLSVSEQTILVFIGSMFEQLVKEMRQYHQDQRRDRLLEHMLKIHEDYVYVIDRKSHIIHYVSDNLASYFPGKNLIGKNCYEVIRNCDHVCDDCPLHSNNPQIIIEQISPSPLITKVLNYAGSPTEIAISLRVPTRENYLSNALFVDEELAIKNKARIIADLREALYSHYSGFVLAIKVNYKENEEHPYSPEDKINHLIDITQAIIEAGYETVLFRVNENTLAIHFPQANRSDLFRRVEDIYKHISLEATSLSPDIYFALAIMEYPVDCSDATMLEEIIKDGIERSEKAGPNKIFVIKGRFVRPADRTEYILDFYETATNRNYWEAYVQPLINLDTEYVTGGEMLIRLFDPNRNSFLPPNDFVNLYSEHHMMCEQEKTIIRRVGEMWRSLGYTVFRSRGIDRISVNISYDTITNPDFHGFLRGVISQYKFPNNFLQLEIDEDITMLHQDDVRNFIRKNSDLKIKFILDNFTGRNLSPQSISSLGFHYLKLEKAAIRSIENDSDSYLSFIHLVNRLKSLNLILIVKGVETERQSNIIRSLGIQYCEGYYYAKPMTMDDYEKYIVSEEHQSI